MSTTTSRDPQLPQLIQELEGLHLEMLSLMNENLPVVIQIHADNRTSANNLLHYLALRRHDIRELQERLAALGLSSLGCTEGHALGAVRTVADVLSWLNQINPAAVPRRHPSGKKAGACWNETRKRCCGSRKPQSPDHGHDAFGSGHALRTGP